MALFSTAAVAGFLSVSATSFIAIAATGALNVAVGIGINKLAVALSGGAPEGPSFGVTGQLQRGADLPVSFLLGEAATAGSLIYSNAWSEDKNTPYDFLTHVIALSDLPIQSLDNLWINGTECSVNYADGIYKFLGFDVPEFRDRGGDRGNVWVRFFDGTQTAAESFLTDYVSTPDREWDSAAILEGVSYIIITARMNRELFSGFPQYLLGCTGIPLYDLSRDSSVGGVGPQRWDDPTTWGGSGDKLPAVQIYNLLRGIQYNGEWFYGGQTITEAQLPTAHWIEQIEKCREGVLAAGGEEFRFRSGGEVTVNTEPLDVIQALLDTCNGRISEVGGVYKLFVGEPGASVVSLTDYDVITTSDQSFVPFFGMAETVNGVTAQYPEPSLGWVTETAPPLYNPEFESEDGGRRLLTNVNLPFAPYGEQVQRLLKASLNEARRARRHTITLPPRFYFYEPGEVVTWTSVRNGYVAKKFRIDGVADLPDGDVIWDITEIDPTDYDFDTNADFTPIAGGSTAFFALPPQEFSGWSVALDPSAFPARPKVLFGWDATKSDTDAVHVRGRVQGQTEIQITGRFDEYELGYGRISVESFKGQTLEFQGRFVPGTSRPTEWSDWLSIAVPDVGFTLDDMDAAVAIGIEAGSQALADGIALGNNQLDIYLRITEEQATNADNFDGARAAIFTEQTIREEADLAQATLITGLGAALGDAESRILTVESTKVDASGAVAAISQELSASNGEFEALANFTSIANAAANSSQAIYLFTAQAGQADAALEIAALSDGNLGSTSRVKLTSDVIIMDSNLSAFGGIVQSTGAVVGEQGWILNDDGSIQAADIQDLRRYTYSGFEDLRGIGTTEITVFDQASGVDFISGIRRLKGTCDVRASAVITTDTEYRISVYIDAYVSGSPVNIFESSRTHVLGSATSPGSVRELSEAIEVEVPTDAADVPGSISFIGPTSEVDPRDIEGFRVRISGNRTGVLSYWKFEFYQ